MLLLLLVFLSPPSHAFGPGDFQEIAPYHDTERRRCANFSPDEWRVSLGADGKVAIEKHQRQKEQVLVLPTHGGFFKTSNFGELGGRLIWVKDEKIWKGPEKNFSALFEDNHAVWAFGGLDRETVRKGYAYRYVWKKDEPQEEKEIPLAAEPVAVSRFGPEKFAIASVSGVELLEKGALKPMLGADFSGLFPNSVVVEKSGDIYVGLRFAVARFSKKKRFELSWLVRNKCVGVKDGQPVYE